MSKVRQRVEFKRQTFVLCSLIFCRILTLLNNFGGISCNVQERDLLRFM